MTTRTDPPDSTRAPGTSSVDPAIDRIIVQLATWGGAALLAMTILTAVATRDPSGLDRALMPASVTAVGWYMLLTNNPRAVAQLIVGMAGLVIAVASAPDTIPGDPILGLLVMSIIGTVMTRRWVAPFAIIAAASIGFTSFAWDTGVADRSDRAMNAFVAMIAYAITAWLLIWLRQRSDRQHDQLQALIKTKDQFVATVSHELRTPLTTIVGLAHELDDRFDDFDRAEIDGFIEMLVGEGTDVANIVEDLLVAARADIGTLALTCTALDLRTELVVATGDTNAVAIDTSALEGAATIRADALRFRQIVRNLIANAHRYGGDEVRIVASIADEASIEVRDNGAAIPSHEREVIFEPYHRSQRADGLPGSAGLGLTVSRRLARLMDGDVSYHHDGRESVFTLRLPAESSEQPLAVAGS